MPQTINKTSDLQMIAGVFSDPKNADKALAGFQEIGFPLKDLQVLVQTDVNAADKIYATQLQDRDFAEAQARFYDERIRTGKTFIAVHDVIDPKPVIEIFDRFGAEYNPDGSRNVRQDVAGMTAGSGAGALVGGGIGLAAGGPVGAAVGAATGAIIGGSAGAAAGKSVEHSK